MTEDLFNNVDSVEQKEFTRNVNLNAYTKPKREALIKDYLPRGAYYGCLYGESGSGKTFVALDMALTVASGIGNWHGIPAEEGKVAYLTKEGNVSLDTRIKCWADYHKVSYNKIFSNLVELAYDTTDPAKIVMNDSIPEYSILKQELKRKGPFAFIVLDTYLEFFDGDNENDSVEVQKFNISAKGFATELNTNLMVIHHSKKFYSTEELRTKDPYFVPSDGRGSSALKGALDYQFSLGGKIREEAGSRFMISKMKDGKLEGKDSSIIFKGELVELKELGTDKYGEYESSLVPIRTDAKIILDPNVREQKEWLERMLDSGKLPYTMFYLFRLKEDPKSSMVDAYFESDDLKELLPDYLEKKKVSSNELNPKQGGFIGRMIKAGLLSVELIGRKCDGKYRYTLTNLYSYDNPEDNKWNLDSWETKKAELEKSYQEKKDNLEVTDSEEVTDSTVMNNLIDSKNS